MRLELKYQVHSLPYQGFSIAQSLPRATMAVYRNQVHARLFGRALDARTDGPRERGVGSASCKSDTVPALRGYANAASKTLVAYSLNQTFLNKCS